MPSSGGIRPFFASQYSRTLPRVWAILLCPQDEMHWEKEQAEHPAIVDGLEALILMESSGGWHEPKKPRNPVSSYRPASLA